MGIDLQYIKGVVIGNIIYYKLQYTYVKKRTVTYFDRFKTETKYLDGSNMHQILRSYTRGEIKHLSRYQLVIFNLEKNRREVINFDKLNTVWRKELVPIHIIYSRSYDFEKWKRYDMYNDVHCEMCKHYLKWTVNGLSTVIHICNMKEESPLIMNNPSLKSDKMLRRHPLCPLVYESVEYKLE